MSLITKLDPNVREARRRRKAVCEGLLKMPGTKAAVAGALLRRFCKLSHLTGVQKERALKQALTELRARGAV
jgi:hypothetical protein